MAHRDLALLSAYYMIKICFMTVISFIQTSTTSESLCGEKTRVTRLFANFYVHLLLIDCVNNIHLCTEVASFSTANCS